MSSTPFAQRLTSVKRFSKVSPLMRQSIPVTIVNYVLMVLLGLVVLIPLLIVCLTAFKSKMDFANGTPLSLPTAWIFDNFAEAWNRGNLFRAILNTMFLVIVSVGINVVLATSAAYGLQRFNFRIKPLIIGIFGAAMIIPVIVTEVARFKIVQSLGMYNTLFGPLLLYAGTDLFQIYIVMQFLQKIPRSLDESAMIDGASRWRIFRSIIFPLLLPAAATMGIVKTVDIMNDMYIPYLYMPAKELKTLSTALMDFAGERFSDMTTLAGGIVLIIIPVLILYLFAQKLIFRGMTAGAIKE